MRSPAAHRLPRAMRGLSLVELMIGLAIGLVLSLGMVTMITGTSRGFRDLDESARMQEGAADALRYIGDSVFSTETWPTTYKPTPNVVCTNPQASQG